MSMSPDIVCGMSMEQINTTLDRRQRELAALLEDQRVLREERDRRISARRPRAAVVEHPAGPRQRRHR
jgi:hypothetical protein